MAFFCAVRVPAIGTSATASPAPKKDAVQVQPSTVFSGKTNSSTPENALTMVSSA
jgi:hypothetical protein